MMIDKDTLALIAISFFAVGQLVAMKKLITLEMKTYKIESLVDYLIEKDKLK